MQGISNQRLDDQNLIYNTWNSSLRITGSRDATDVSSLAVDHGAYTFYQDLGSFDDPPRCMQVCPQRRCVVFGHSSGIEVHWNDARTRQSLARWFLLTTPSDCLSFLFSDSRSASAKMLCVLSSVAHPKDKLAINRNFSIDPSVVNSFLEPCSFDLGSRSNCYHAIPLSDNRQVLFIDCLTNRLTLGCFEGNLGIASTISFVPPMVGLTPKLYAATKDLSQGLYVVAAYDDILMLYSVPSEVYKVTRFDKEAETGESGTARPLSTEERRQNHWQDWWDEPSVLASTAQDRGDYGESKRPTTVRGTEISRLSGICELSIQTQPDILIWAFTAYSQCKTWRLRSHPGPIPGST